MNIFRSKLFWIGVIAIFLILFWLLGGVNSGLNTLKKHLASEEIKISEEYKIKMEMAEKSEKVATEKVRILGIKIENLEKRDLEKIKEIQAIKVENEKIKKELEDAERKLEAINVPDSASDRVIQFHSLGLRSATIVSEPKSNP